MTKRSLCSITANYKFLTPTPLQSQLCGSGWPRMHNPSGFGWPSAKITCMCRHIGPKMTNFDKCMFQ